MSKRSIILICSFLTIIILCIFVYFIINAHNSGDVKQNLIVNEVKEVDVEKENIVPTLSSNNEKVYPNAALVMKQLYKKCGHVIEEEYTVPIDIVNMTEEEVENYYNDWNLDEFSNEKITIYKENEGICEEHYILKDINGVITIYRSNNDGSEIFVSSTEIITKYLPETDIDRLAEGIKIVGKRELSIFLEDFE